MSREWSHGTQELRDFIEKEPIRPTSDLPPCRHGIGENRISTGKNLPELNNPWSASASESRR